MLSAEVLDIMSADYHEKYEEYKRALREKHAKEMLNKQKSKSLLFKVSNQPNFYFSFCSNLHF